MTTMQSLLTRALRKTRGVALEDTPTPNEMAAALEDAQAFFLTLTARTLTDVLTAVSYTAGENERVFNTSGSPVTITLPTTITERGVVRAPRGGAIVEVAETATERHIYITELASWKQVSGLALADEQPFGPTMDDAFADMLAVRFCDSVVMMNVTSTMVQLATQGRTAFDARFHQPINTVTDPGIRAWPRYYQELVI